MRVYITRRLLILIPTLLLVTMIIFLMVHFVPGDIVDAMRESIGLEGGVDRQALEQSLGLDAPIHVQYLRWIGIIPQIDGSFAGVLQGNLGVSWWRASPVVELAALRWPVTLQLGIMGLIAAQLVALPIGIYSALRQDTWGDYLARTFAILCISVPGFWLATLVIVVPATLWNYMPPIMLVRFSEDPLGNLRMFVAPALILGMALAGGTMRMTRTMMLEVLRQDYIRTAWSKGLREKVVVVRHALKNALIPVITMVGLQMPVLLGGTVVIEEIFNLPGMGRLMISAISQRDAPLINGLALLFAVFLVLINLAVDLMYAYLDPRIRYE